MTYFQNLLLLVALPAVLMLSGYWLAARLTDSSATERIAVAILAGLGVLLWTLATVNFFRPLSGAWAWLCLWPLVVTLASGRGRNTAWRDVVAVLANRRGAIALLSGIGFLVFLLWPLLTRPSLVFYDGTSNHDAFFWILGAEHLMRHSYMELATESPLRPLMNAVNAIVGWSPAWGRMGAEGFLAATSSILGTEPVKLYVAATAALLVPWIAGVFLAVRTFLVGRLHFVTLIALVTLQPVFVYFHGNANLPNLLGALCAGAAVIATERALRPGGGRMVWLGLLAVSVHGLFCSYPEMIPFVVMPAGLLWLRAWFAGTLHEVWRPASAAALGWIAGIALNPASSVRAARGFVASFDAARADDAWANLFAPISAVQYPAALATLSVGAVKSLGVVAVVLLTLVLVTGLFLAWRRALDRVGALLILSGAGALLLYTLGTGFNYGWQKTVQFGGVLWVAFFPVAIVDALAGWAPADPWRRLLARVALGGALAFFGYTTVFNGLDSHKWSTRKILTQDWFALRDYARTQLRDIPVLVDAASFRMAFFHGMWATYFLPQSDLYFADRGFENGGYLRGGVKKESDGPLPPLDAYLVGRPWAETFDANSPRRFTGDILVLLEKANRVSAFGGLQPENGLPENAEAIARLDVRPHSPSTLVMVLAPHRAENESTVWRMRREAEGQPLFTAEVAGPPPWRIDVPLVPGRLNRVEFVADPAPAANPLPPFVVREIRIEAAND